MEIHEGSLVISKSGRDKLKHFIVTRIENDYVFLLDGNIRKVEKPKKKKMKHIQATNMFSEYINKCIKKNKDLTNKEIKKEITKLVGKGIVNKGEVN